MLNQETKRRIDSARDILVGKVPDPKAQVEQITTAMIYKFMDDMDKEAQEVGGKSKFFTNGYEKYSWANVLDPKLGGQERLNIYGEAIVKMQNNPHIPQLFRDIFKDAFLPYRSPETLSMFLKEINGFKYLHSEDLGDAFEYLLSILGSQGDAGQFRTPRHIIDFIVDVVDPKKEDTILDPACGTAGFLVSSFKHIVEANKEKLSPENKKRMMNNIVGYDISPDMVKLSKVNMYLHGFPTPHIYEYDTLSSEDRWEETYDVIMANPPFMTPKGGIRPHKRFSVQANRAEVLFVNYIMEHLNNNGRAGIIVPEGIIFKNETAYKQLRKLLVEDGLFAVITLPAGVFNPYSGVKTSILFLDNSLAKKTDKILFLSIANDGFDLGVQRRQIDGGQLDEAKSVIKKFQQNLVIGQNELETYAEDVATHKELKGKNLTNYETKVFEVLDPHIIEKIKILNSSDHNLTSNKYIFSERNAKITGAWPMVELGEILDYEQPTKYIVSSENYNNKYKTPVLTAGKTFILGYTKETNGIFEKDLPVIIFDDFTTATKLVDFPFKVKSSAMKILHAKKEKAQIKYVFYMMKKIKFSSGTHKRYWISEYSKIKIPLPTLEDQEKIMEEIDSCQSIIDSAKNIINNSQIEVVIKPEWRLVPLKDVLSKVSETINPQIKKGPVNYIGLEDIEKDSGNLIRKTIEEYKNIKSLKSVFKKEDILYGKLRPNLNKVWYSEFDGICSTDILVLRKSNESILPEFYFYILKSKDFNREVLKGIKGAQLPRISYDYISSLLVPLPSPVEQLKIVLELNTLRKIMIHDNKKLIEIFEKKIEEKINKIWCSLSS